MDQWEYMSVVITVENRQYVATHQGTKIWGVDAILNYWAAYGWELVTIVPTFYDGTKGGPFVSIHAIGLFATFRRRKAPIAPYGLLPQE